MALSLGKLFILVGAGIAGSVIAKEGRLPDVSGLASGAFKVVLRQLKSDDPAPTVKKQPHNDALLAQVNSLRQELQLLARDRSITIVNASGTGGRKYATVIVIVVVGYGYVWWKGWKLPDLMFATRRGLSDACTSIGNQMGKLYESIGDTKKKLSARINGLDKNLEECAAITESTREDIYVIQRKADTISEDSKSFHVAVHVLESKIKEIEEKQASSSSSSRPALELPPVSPSSRGSQSGSARLSLEPPSVTPSSREPKVDKSNGSSSGLFGLISGVYGPLLTRTRSATDAVVQKTRSTS
ncbi:hypothetical protein GmHk_18G053444 [Glycine max]|nr:hypothetical protein GmHk_18G053444 [Glycine max]KAH1200282.1 hypothetical protein GmHk_18G053444 [Glycine max]